MSFSNLLSNPLNFPKCKRNFYANNQSIRNFINTVRLFEDDDKYTITMLRPFYFTGFSAPPDPANGQIDFINANDIANNFSIVRAIMLAFQDANENNVSQDLFTTYEGQYMNYMYYYFNADLNQFNQNAFNLMVSMWYTYWLAEQAVPSNNTILSYNEFHRLWVENVDLKFFLPPGVYTIWKTGAQTISLPCVNSSTYEDGLYRVDQTDIDCSALIGVDLSQYQWYRFVSDDSQGGGQFDVNTRVVGRPAPNWAAYPGDPIEAVRNFLVGTVVSGGGNVFADATSYPTIETNQSLWGADQLDALNNNTYSGAIASKYYDPIGSPNILGFRSGTLADYSIIYPAPPARHNAIIRRIEFYNTGGIPQYIADIQAYLVNVNPELDFISSETSAF